MIFLDTSAIYALADKADPHHGAARAKFDLALNSRETFLLHNYILLESVAVLQSRLGFPSAGLFLKEARTFEVEWVNPSLHQEALKEWQRIAKRGISFVDCTSFVVMRQRRVQAALAFDPHFHEQGFLIY